MHALTHFQAIVDKHYTARKPYRWLHMAAAAKSAAITHLGSEHRIYEQAKELLGPDDRLQSRSAITGAWSDAVMPSCLRRYSRSTVTSRTRCTTGAVPSSMSMRRPMPRWKAPPR